MNPNTPKTVCAVQAVVSVIRCAVAVAVAVFPLVSFADEQTRQVQEELRKRNLYFGEIDGRKSNELTKALQRYQQRKGLANTGAFDPDTLGSLNVTSPVATAQPTSYKDASWPDVPVLKSDVPRRIKEEDRRFLESLDQSEETAPAEESTPALTPLPPPSEPAAESSRAQPAAITMERAEAFVRGYLSACESNQLRDEMAFYSGRVKYFDQGVVDRAFIEHDVAAFYRRWPERSYELTDCKLLSARGDEAVVQFRIAFKYHGAQHRVAGRTENTFTLKQTADGLKFTALKEQRIRGA